MNRKEAVIEAYVRGIEAERPARLAAQACMAALAAALEALVRAVEHDHNVGMFVEDARNALRQAWRLP